MLVYDLKWVKARAEETLHGRGEKAQLETDREGSVDTVKTARRGGARKSINDNTPPEYR